MGGCLMRLLNELPTLCPYYLQILFSSFFFQLFIFVSPTIQRYVLSETSQVCYTNTGENTQRVSGQTGAGMVSGVVQTRPLI